MKIELEEAALRYFIENAHPRTGLVRDKAYSFQSDDNNLASMASTGFGLAVLANAAARGKLSRAPVLAYYNKVMRFSRDHIDREHGWYPHFVFWDTGITPWDVYNDFSSIDTALFIAGALYASTIFPYSEGASITKELYRAMDFWWFMTDGGAYPQRRTISIGYDRVHGFSKYQWSIYAEQMILVVLGIGHPTWPIPPEAWNAWERRKYSYDTSSGTFSFVGMDMPLFVHQYSHLFVDFRRFHDDFPNYFYTSILASQFNRKIGQDSSSPSPPFPAAASFSALQQPVTNPFWGISAGETPPVSPNGDAGYRAFNPMQPNETMCIACAIGSAMFIPDLVLEDALAWRNGPYASRIWGLYGFTDSVDLSQNWFSKRSFGITVGAAYLSLANMDDSTSVWNRFNEIPEIKNALAKIATRENQQIAGTGGQKTSGRPLAAGLDGGGVISGR